MAKTVVNPKCPDCGEVIPFLDPNYCPFCRYELDDETKEKYSYPKCPSEIKEGHCDECQEKQLKECDNCGSTNKVKYRIDFGCKCLCLDCRLKGAEALAKTRSW